MLDVSASWKGILIQGSADIPVPASPGSCSWDVAEEQFLQHRRCLGELEAFLQLGVSLQQKQKRARRNFIVSPIGSACGFPKGFDGSGLERADKGCCREEGSVLLSRKTSVE